MSGSGRTKILLLLGLLLVWGGILAVRHQAAAPPAVTAAVPTARQPIAQGGGLPRLKHDLLEAPRPPLPAQPQDIFGAQHVQPPPAPVASADSPKPAAPAAPPAPPDPFLEEVKRLRYLGYIELESTRKALVLQEKELHMLEAGDTVGGRFRVKRIADDYVQLVSPDGSKDARLDLKQDSASPSPGPPRTPRPGFPVPRM